MSDDPTAAPPPGELEKKVNTEQVDAEPRRLIHGNDLVGSLLQQHDSLWRGFHRPNARLHGEAFDALKREHERRTMLRSGLAAGATATVALLFGLGGRWLASHPVEMLKISPEALAPHHMASAPPRMESGRGADSPSPTDEAPPVAQPAARIEPTNGPRSPLVARDRAPARTPGTTTHGSRAVDAFLPTQVLPKQRASSVENHDCSRLIGAHDYVDVRACYTQRAVGTGISAELAYLERARFEQLHGRDPQAALRSLEEYQARFPRGTLQPEATLARIRLLVASGHSASARAAISRALPLMAEKATTLRELAIDLAVSSGDCNEARELLKQIPIERLSASWKKSHLGRCQEQKRDDGSEGLTPSHGR